MSDQAREAAQHAENEAREYEDGRFAAVVFPLAEAVRTLADEIDRHDRSLGRVRRDRAMTQHSQPGSQFSDQECGGRARVCRDCVRAISLQWWDAIARHPADIAPRCELCELGLAEVCGEHFLDDVAEHRARMRQLGQRIGERDPPDTLAAFTNGVERGRAQATREDRS